MNEYIAKLVQEMIWKPEPLSEEDIFIMAEEFEKHMDLIKFTRAIEQRHGIK